VFCAALGHTLVRAAGIYHQSLCEGTDRPRQGAARMAHHRRDAAVQAVHHQGTVIGYLVHHGNVQAGFNVRLGDGAFCRRAARYQPDALMCVPACLHALQHAVRVPQRDQLGHHVQDNAVGQIQERECQVVEGQAEIDEHPGVVALELRDDRLHVIRRGRLEGLAGLRCQ